MRLPQHSYIIFFCPRFKILGTFKVPLVHLVEEYVEVLLHNTQLESCLQGMGNGVTAAVQMEQLIVAAMKM